MIDLPLRAALGAALLLTASCATHVELNQLRDENERLQQALDQLRQKLADAAPADLRTVPVFTVGLAASERDFDADAFAELLQKSLAASAQDSDVEVTRESDDAAVDKVRGMLVQQYLAADEIPVRITNLTFKLRDATHAFKIGGAVVPNDALQIQRTGDGGATAVYQGELHAALHRDANGHYSLPYEELGGGSGKLDIRIRDVDILDPDQKARAERQGDISLNWNLELEHVEVYRVEGFKGDVGLFLTNMRYGDGAAAVGQYQNRRDLVFLFGYGRYVTGLVNQIRTPARITSVEVAPIDAAKFDQLTAAPTEEELLDRIGDVQWQPCTFVDFAGDQKIWERPGSVPFPFVSRQLSQEEGRTFYVEYGSEGGRLLGDYEH